MHSWIGFTVSHFFTKVPGFFSKVSGAFVVAASITTSAGLLDDHLRSDRFFDVARFPTAGTVGVASTDFRN